MQIEFQCPRCGARLTVPRQYAGYEGRCKGCGQIITAPLADELKADIPVASISPSVSAVSQSRAEGTSASRTGKDSPTQASSVQPMAWNLGVFMVRSLAVSLALLLIGQVVLLIIVHRLSCKDPETIQQSARILGLVRYKPAVNPLIGVLSNKQPQVIDSAMDALLRMGQPAVGPLVDALRNADQPALSNAQSVLARMGKEAVAPLISALASDDLAFRDNVETTLGRMADITIQPLGHVISNEADVAVVVGAIEALAKSKDARSVPVLGNALRDGRPGVRIASVDALADLIGTGDPRVIPYIMGAVQDSDADVQIRAIAHLVDSGSPAIVDQLWDFMVHIDPDTETVTHTRKRILIELGGLKGKAKVRYLHLLDSNLDFVIGNDYALIESGCPSVEPILIHALNQGGGPLIADELLNCGNPRLERAARRWAARDPLWEVRKTNEPQSGPIWGVY